MRRQNIFPEKPDSDRSYSADEEDIDGDLSDDCVSLGAHAEREDGLQILSQLEKLRDAGETSAVWSSVKPFEEQAELPLEDEVEVPDFGNDRRFICSPKSESTCCTAEDDEIISDDEESTSLAKLSTLSSHRKIQEVGFHASETKEKELPTVSVVVKDARESVQSIQNASCSLRHATHSRANHCSKASEGNSKAKLSFGFHRKDEHLLSCISRDEIGGSQKVCEHSEIHEDVKGIDPGYQATDALDDFDQEENEDSEVMLSNALVRGHGCAKHSMADLLDGLHGSSSLPNETSGRKRRPRMGFADKRNTLTTGQGKPDDEGEVEAMDSRSPSEDENNFDERKLPAAYCKRPSMADCIQQVLDSTSLDSGSALNAVPKSLGFGLFGRLQQVMQIEKESEPEFLKKLQSGASASCNLVTFVPKNRSSSDLESIKLGLIKQKKLEKLLMKKSIPKIVSSCLSKGGSGFIDVMILSRSLDAKLTVCLCSVEQNQKGTPSSHCSQADLTGRKRTVIFNPRICNNVDLEIGNLIRIHSPWEEVEVMGHEKRIILSTYFSHVSV